jgi:hypothetical protein
MEVLVVDFETIKEEIFIVDATYRKMIILFT